MQRDGQLHRPQVRPQVPAVGGDDIDQDTPDVGCKLVEPIGV
jgi:hypothetical protein